MTKFLALTQGTAEWLIGKTGLIDAIFDHLVAPADAFSDLKEYEFVEGPIRIAVTPDNELGAVWNIDYMTGTGEEIWGFIKIDSDMGLRAEADIGHEVLERCLYVINQRLQGLRIDGSYIHRPHPNGVHTCLAGRGSRAWHFSIGFFERVVATQKNSANAVVCVGPSNDPGYKRITHAALREGKRLEELVMRANRLISPTRKKSIAEADVFPDLRAILAPFSVGAATHEYADVQVATSREAVETTDAYKTYGLTYDDWLRQGSQLTDVQRRILNANPLDRHPLRIVGPGGSGKTLLMQLLAVRTLRVAAEDNKVARVLYVVHNLAMRQKVEQRFAMLNGRSGVVDGEKRVLDVRTLLEYGKAELDLEISSVIDADAHESKVFQLDQISNAMETVYRSSEKEWSKSKLLKDVFRRAELQKILGKLIAIEISTAIKGHGLTDDKKKYIQSEVPLSRFHATLEQLEREFLFAVFEAYRDQVFGYYEVLDTDDVAISLLLRLRAPVWALQRKAMGYDYVFVDETQLFNENERRVLPLLTRGGTSHVPIALALDEAQELYGQRSAGLSTLGIKDIANESLASIHRSTKSIVSLAFHVIQRSTDLFGADFPDFTSIAEKMERDTHPLAQSPIFVYSSGKGVVFAKMVAGIVGKLRAENLRQIAVVCQLPLQVLAQRGERIPPQQPLVVLSRPTHIGGQEFDAVVLVGLEQGIVPPRVQGNDALSAALEQQLLRELYLAITRARYRVIVSLSAGSSPTAVLQDAQKHGLISGQK